jgi:mevalonate kinase
MYCDFQTKTSAKWILAGEHAVIRGHGALIFPIPGKQLQLQYLAEDCSLTVEYAGSSGSVVCTLFRLVLDHSLTQMQLSPNDLRGRFLLHSSFPVGVGMGASAAVCAALSQWYVAQGIIAASNCFDFAKSLEHLFHGTSSGLDIVGVTAEGGMYFKAGKAEPIQQVIQPQWYISSCQEMGMTSQCIQQVQALWQRNPDLAQQIDEQMAQAVIMAKQVLEQGGADAIPKLTQAIHQAAACFTQWGLVSERLQRHMDSLLDAGALAVKPTGSGGGGYVVSLWDKSVPSDKELEPLF